jgi:hypothetical protein
MIPKTPSIDDTLDSLDSLTLELGNPNPADLIEDIDIETNTDLIELVELEAGAIDPRLKLLSHSSRTTLHKCPRKYQLYRLSANKISMSDQKEQEQGITFDYGTIVGAGMQSTLEGKSDDAIYMEAFLEWSEDLYAENTRQKKSFWLALFAIQKFIALREAGFLEEYSLVYYEGKPAVELSFQVNLPGGFRYRGFVDAVLEHKTTGEIMVLEAKTSSGTAQSAMYKNSGQALGYSVVLDILFPELSSYLVLYLVYETKSMEYKELPYTKSLLQRALWLQELLIDTKMIEVYESYGSYPMHGESCFDFFRECEYLSLCTLSTKNLTKPLTVDIVDKVAREEGQYQFVVDFSDLVEAQIAKGL